MVIANHRKEHQCNSPSKWLRNSLVTGSCTFHNKDEDHRICIVITLIMVEDSKAWYGWHGDNPITCNTSTANILHNYLKTWKNKVLSTRKLTFLMVDFSDLADRTSVLLLGWGWPGSIYWPPEVRGHPHPRRRTEVLSATLRKVHYQKRKFSGWQDLLFKVFIPILDEWENTRYYST